MKRSRRGKIPKVSKHSGKRAVTAQNSGELYTKSPNRAIPDFRKTFAELTKRTTSEYI